MGSQQRPTGITVLAVLAVIGGLFGLLGGVALLGFSPLVGLIALIVAVVDFVFAYGAWTLKPWGWTLGVALQAISILGIILSLSQGASIGSQILPVAIAAIILYYLFRKDIQEAFGRM